MKFNVYMERTMSMVVQVDADSWQDALRVADELGVPAHEDGDIAQDWTSVIATGEDGVEHMDIGQR